MSNPWMDHYTPAQRAAYGREAQAERQRMAEWARRCRINSTEGAAATDAREMDRQAEARQYTYAGCRAMLADRAALYDRDAGMGAGRLVLDAVIAEGWYDPLKAAAADLLVERVMWAMEATP